MYQASSHAKPYGQQHQSNQHHPPQQQRESTIDGFSNVPRSISTPVWISTGSNPASSLHLHSSTMCNNVGVGNSTGVMGGGRGGTHAVPNASCSSSSSGSVLSFWDQRVPSDSDLTMTTALTWSDSQSNALPEIGNGRQQYYHQNHSYPQHHHRYASSTASLPAISPPDLFVASHPTSALQRHHMGAVSSNGSSSQRYIAAGSKHHQQQQQQQQLPPYRPSCMSIGSIMSSQQHQHACHSTSTTHAAGVANALPNPGSAPPPLALTGFIHGPCGPPSSSSSSVASFAAGPSCESYPPPPPPPQQQQQQQSSTLGTDSQYLSYLPPAQNYSRFYANPNPFEIKHRRRTTKTQFCVLESTFRDIPKPNATLRKQISVQLNMPVRAVQIWFQNRRAKAKAMEKKRGHQTSQDSNQDQGQSTQDGKGRSITSNVDNVVVKHDHHDYNGGVDLKEVRDGGQTLSGFDVYSMNDDMMSVAHASQHNDDDGDRGKRMGRTMDLRRFRMQGDWMRYESSNYQTLSSNSTFHSINVDNNDISRSNKSNPISAYSSSSSSSSLLPIHSNVGGLASNSSLEMGFTTTLVHGESQGGK
ncbi:uncharacterized protein MEPE_03334 [Melanopsichium pennsylvanicum]|uniref:Homeobox domain-containing protein n=1 Tax=Melanopsichium pennsylvanicum TaxID=63383 RepID=A0AAJ4XLY5_9BASI|nr:uncharacterized protein MEPE_03334 [Melanopsichium pennsylvanicum]